MQPRRLPLRGGVAWVSGAGWVRGPEVTPPVFFQLEAHVPLPHGTVRIAPSSHSQLRAGGPELGAQTTLIALPGERLL